MSEQGKDEQAKSKQHILTNRQGHPVYDNQNNRTVGDRGPTVLENYQFLEKISHFDRECIPERVVHARGAGAHGYFAEVEQVAFGTGVLVDGLDFSDDKLLQGRTFSYSDTQRHRVGANYLQLPINRPKTRVATNRRDGQMAYHVDGAEAGENPHVNYEPASRTDSLREAPRAGKDYTPYVSGYVVRQKIGRPNNYGQAGARYRALEDWEHDELISNLVNLVGQCDRDVQERMVSQCDEEYGRRVAEGLGILVGERPAVGTAGAR